MLCQLTIRNLALLDSVALDFGPGFTTVTGETGAGKSVLIGGLSLLAGGRADKTLIREGADSCEVEAFLEISKDHCGLHDFLEKSGLPPCDEGALVIRRIIERQKPARAWVNGVMVTGAILGQLADYWIDFHGPEAPHQLAEETAQRSLLDAYTGLDKDLAIYQAAYHEWKELLRQVEALKSEAKLSEDERAFYTAQLEKLEMAIPSIEAIEELETKYTLHAKSQELIEHLGRLSTTLGSSGTICTAISKLTKDAQAVTLIDGQAFALQERLESLLIEIQDLSYEYSQQLNAAYHAAEEGVNLEDKMNKWLEVKRLYGPSAEQVFAKKLSIKERLSLQDTQGERLAELEKAATSQKEALLVLADALDDKRQKAGVALSKAVAELLPGFGLKHAKLAIVLEKLPQLHEYGQSRVIFTFAANAGQSPLPLGKIASSGEMARVMLAFKAVLATIDKTPLLVFDEVDANVGGEIGAQVGKELRALSRHHQVIAVTHLPQVAALGHSHFVVTKDQVGERTSVSIALISKDIENRLGELARMLGDRSSASALKHAEALLGALA